MRKRRLLIWGILGSLLVPSCQSEAVAPESETEPPAESAAVSSRDPLDGKVRIPAGPFVFGASEALIEAYLSRSLLNFPGMVEAIRNTFVTPPRTETLPGYYIDEFEVTNSQFKEFVDATGYQPSSAQDFLQHWERGKPMEWAENFPVVWVSQQDAAAYCRWAGGTLPTELQWEKAARGGDGRAFPWGNTFPAPDTSNFGRDSAEPVGNRPGDVSPYQVYDLGGNVSELTQTTVLINGVEHAVTRGGSYRDSARETFATYRELGATPETRRENLGFRCAAAAGEPGTAG